MLLQRLDGADQLPRAEGAPRQGDVFTQVHRLFAHFEFAQEFVFIALNW